MSAPNETQAIAVRRAAVARLRTEERLNAARIAVRLGVGARTVERDLGALGLARPPAPFTDDELSRLEALLDEGMPCAQAASVIGRSPHAVRRRFPDKVWTPRQVGQHGAGVRWP